MLQAGSVMCVVHAAGRQDKDEESDGFLVEAQLARETGASPTGTNLPTSSDKPELLNYSLVQRRHEPWPRRNAEKRRDSGRRCEASRCSWRSPIGIGDRG